MKIFLCISIALFIGLLVSVQDSNAQCVCWPNGIEAELNVASEGTICEREGDDIILISLSNPELVCGFSRILRADFTSCSEASLPDEDNMPEGFACGPGLQSMSDLAEQTCRQDLDDFCDQLNPRNVPTLSEWGLVSMAAILGIIGFMVIRKRQVTT
ncbi:MAG: IPTL-CTERM sorting domain-containing protein [Thermodesulfobacteriota bacterium]